MTQLRPVRHRAAVGLAALVLPLSAVSACGGGDDDQGPKGSPSEVLAQAKDRLDETSGIEFSLKTGDDPSGVDAFLSSASGTLTHAPAFEGKASGRLNGIPASDIPIIAVDGDFYYQLLGQWSTIDPAKLCAPDPAGLLDPDHGIGTLLSEATGVEKGKTRRAADDNTVTVTPYTATVPGDAVKNILPCAPGDSFDATFTVTGDGALRGAEISGEFFDGAGDMTYDVAITKYDVEKDIAKP